MEQNTSVGEQTKEDYRARNKNQTTPDKPEKRDKEPQINMDKDG